MAAAVVFGLMTTGCASLSGDGVETGIPDEESTTVEVSNHNWLDVTIYAVERGTRTRLGTVTSMTTRTFELPAGLQRRATELRLVAAPIGSTETHRTDSILIDPGDRIEWNLENELALSSYWVRSDGR